MDIDTNRSMSSEAAEYLHRAKACSRAAERTTDPEIREMLLRLVADLTVAALFCSIERIDPAETGSPSCAA